MFSRQPIFEPLRICDVYVARKYVIMFIDERYIAPKSGFPLTLSKSRSYVALKSCQKFK